MAELSVGIDGRPAEQGGRQVTRSLQSIREEAAKTDRGFKQTNRTFAATRTAAFSLTKTLGLLAAAFGVRQIIAYTNAFQQAQNRIRLVTSSTEELVAVQERVFEIAQRNRVGFEATVDLFTRIARSSDTLGISLERVLKVTDTVSKAITISGGAATEANAAIVQLGQGLASGTLRGDELRSVLEQTPRLARAIADGLGITIGQLRVFGAEGKLTAQAVIGALESQAAVLEAEFGRTLPTISQGFTILRNSIVRTIGLFSESTGAAGGFANMLIRLAQFIQGPLLNGLLQFGDIMGVTFREIGRVMDSIIAGFDSLGIELGPILGDIGRSILRLPLTIIRAFQVMFVEIGGALVRFRTDFEQFVNDIVGTAAVILGDEAVIEAAISERFALMEREEEEMLTLAGVRDTLYEDFAAQEAELTAAIEARAEARARAAETDLSQAPEARPGGISSELTKTREEMDKMLKSLLEQEEALARAQAQGIEYSDALQQIRLESLAAQDAELGPGFLFDATETIEEINRLQTAIDEQQEAETRAQELFDETRTSAEQLEAALADLASLRERFPEIIDTETFERATKLLQERFKGTTDVMSQFAVQAARNMQTSFADFLFDPFDGGVKGMVSSFAEALRRMAAEALSQFLLQKFLGLFAGGGGAFANFAQTALGGFGGGRQFGGNVSAGVPHLVGEGGRTELFVPSQDGRILTAQQAGQQLAPNITVAAPPVIIVDDPKKAVSAMQTREGQQATVATIRANREAIRRELA